MRICVLYRDHLYLYGIPYRMREGQSPRDLQRAYRDYEAPKPGHYGSKQIDISDWVCLDLYKNNVHVKAFLSANSDVIPNNMYEWVDLVNLNLHLSI